MKILINGQLKNVPDVMFGSGHEDTADVSDNIESRFINDCNYCDSSQLQPISKDSVSRCKRYMELERLSYRAVTLEQQALLGGPKEERIDFSQEYAPFRPENLYTWQEAAKQGIPDGCYLFGKFLLSGGETEEGLRWLKIVASRGHKYAKRTLGEYFLDNGEPDEGLRLLQEASDAGDAYACECLANRYDDGDGVPKSKSKFRSYLKRAVLLGNPRALLFLDADELKPSWRWW